MTTQDTLAHFSAAAASMRELSAVQARREAAIERRRNLKSAREFIAANRHRLHELWEEVPGPPRTIAEHMAGARAEMGEERWNELQAEWSTADLRRGVI